MMEALTRDRLRWTQRPAEVQALDAAFGTDAYTIVGGYEIKVFVDDKQTPFTGSIVIAASSNELDMTVEKMLASLLVRANAEPDALRRWLDETT